MIEQSLVIIKPDGIQRRLAGEIISRLEKKGLKLVAAKFIQISEAAAREHYAVHKDKDFFERAVKYISSAPALIMVWSGVQAIDIIRKLIGPTDGTKAAAGTIRGDFGMSVRYNLVHGSDSPKTAEQEINLFFRDEEILDYDMPDDRWLNS